MPVRQRPSAPTHEVPGASFTSLATPSTGSADTAVWAVRIAPGHPPTPHRLTRQEVFIITGGAGVATIAGLEHDLSPGDALVVPSHTPFAIRATGGTDLTAYCCLPVGGQAIIGGGDPFTPPWAR